jgi:hypothetical protein
VRLLLPLLKVYSQCSCHSFTSCPVWLQRRRLWQLVCCACSRLTGAAKPLHRSSLSNTCCQAEMQLHGAWLPCLVGACPSLLTWRFSLPRAGLR